MQAGTKRVCPPRDRAEGAQERPQCATRSGIHNVAVRAFHSVNIGVLTLL